MQKHSLICNNFSGINRSKAVFNSSVITASDMQNVELYSTEINSGVGIRTADGNTAAGLVPSGEIVVNIFESVQKSNNYFFVHTENENEGKIYLFNSETGNLTLKKDGLSLTGKSCATDVAQGWSDLWVFSNGEDLLSIEIGKVNNNNVLDEVTTMNLTDMDGRSIKGMGLVIFACKFFSNIAFTNTPCPIN